jgi:hypothetical protein
MCPVGTSKQTVSNQLAWLHSSFPFLLCIIQASSQVSSLDILAHAAVICASVSQVSPPRLQSATSLLPGSQEAARQIHFELSSVASGLSPVTSLGLSPATDIPLTNLGSFSSQRFGPSLNQLAPYPSVLSRPIGAKLVGSSAIVHETQGLFMSRFEQSTTRTSGFQSTAFNLISKAGPLSTSERKRKLQKQSESDSSQDAPEKAQFDMKAQTPFLKGVQVKKYRGAVSEKSIEARGKVKK